MQQDKTQLFCETQDIYVVSEIMNLFLAELFPNYLNEFMEKNPQKLKFLGFEEDNIKNLILMTKFLSNWLFHYDFINSRLEINVDFWFNFL